LWVGIRRGKDLWGDSQGEKSGDTRRERAARWPGGLGQQKKGSWNPRPRGTISGASEINQKNDTCDTNPTLCCRNSKERKCRNLG